MPIDNLDRADSRIRCLANGSRWWSKQSTSRECSSRLTQIAIRHHQVFLLEPPWIHRYNPTRPSQVRRPNRDHKPYGGVETREGESARHSRALLGPHGYLGGHRV